MSTTLLSLEELSELETRMTHVLPEGTLMDRAGFVAANWIDDQCDAASTIVILCGQGNNGGDGYTAALHLKSRGHNVICVAIGGKKPKTEDALRAYNRWIEKGGEVIEDPYMAPKADVVVDAMLGVGITKAISGDYIDAALWFNERQALHMAIDIPTGIDAERGNWVGGIKGCVADMTLNLISAKAGCFMNDGKDASGMVTLSELDVSVPLSSLSLIDTDDFKHILELRKYHSHKGTYGRCLVVGGDMTIHRQVVVGSSMRKDRKAASPVASGQIHGVVAVDHDGGGRFDFPHPEPRIESGTQINVLSISAVTDFIEIFIGPDCCGISSNLGPQLVRRTERNRVINLRFRPFSEKSAVAFVESPVVFHQKQCRSIASKRNRPADAQSFSICAEGGVAAVFNSRRGNEILIVRGIQMLCGSHLLQLADAGCALRFDFCLVQGRKQKSGKNCDNRNDDQKFYQCEILDSSLHQSSPFLWFPLIFATVLRSIRRQGRNS